MDNTIYAKFNEDGFATGFWQSAAYDPPAEGEERNPIIPADAIKITKQQFDALFNNQSTRKWHDGHVVPCELPAPEPIIPDRLSRRQFRLALIDAGLLEQVEAWILTQDVRTQAAYADSGTFLRTDEMLQQGFAGLGFTVVQINQFFSDASAL